MKREQAVYQFIYFCWGNLKDTKQEVKGKSAHSECKSLLKGPLHLQSVGPNIIQKKYRLFKHHTYRFKSIN